ncbi:anti-sigma factor [Bacillus sp. BP-3]|uniref:anti-sigma factor n=1 Tax=Bacillus sp. BP-3 TaxID=3022773 RepID=UPI00232E7CCB|nr:anti-sigma factor [Bacillus sp. BP-3]MDC2866826.1 anti-sigma factor [Bacillus sp. BP-3]
MTKDKSPSDQEGYKEFLNEALQQTVTPFAEEKQDQALKKGRNRARFTNICLVLTFLLCIQPILYIATMVYYNFSPTNASEIRKVTKQTLSITEPNVYMKERYMKQTLLPFSLQLQFDLSKRVGKKDVRIGTENIHYLFSTPKKVNRNYTIDEPIPEVQYKDNEVLFHPDNYYTSYDSGNEREVLQGLPKESVVEVYVSFRELLSIQTVNETFKNVDVVWYAVDTGLEKKRGKHDGYYVAPIGFPADIISNLEGPFSNETPHEKQFVNILKSLQKHEKLAEEIARAKTLELPKRIAYIEKNGIKSYGAVITGPKEEIEKILENEYIRKWKVGETRLWNWHS